MRRTTPLTAAALLGLALLAPTTSASAAGETCRGEAATIVGTAYTLTGTEGRDVIVTGRASDILALGGDDLICVVPDRLNSNLVDVDAGPGNDAVDTTGTREGFYIDTLLGAGADTFVGGPAGDSVLTGIDGAQPVDAETDVVDTGAGGDNVTTGSTAGPNHDRIDTGTGTDHLDLISPSLAADGLLGGGPDHDVLTLPSMSGDAALDVAAGTLVSAAGTASFSSLEEASATIGSSRLTYRGTTGGDTLTVHARDGVPTLEIATLGGDDRIFLEPATASAVSRIDAGPGTDLLLTGRDSGRLAIDLRTDTLDLDGVRIPAAGLEDVFLLAPEIEMIGGPGDDSLSYDGCDATLRGGPGDDSLGNYYDGYFEAYTFDCTGTASISGGTGADYLRGGSSVDKLSGGRGHDQLVGRGSADRLSGGDGRDLLDGGEGRDQLHGGPGPDQARGGAGADLCRAERKKTCER